MNTFELGTLIRTTLLQPEQKIFQASVENLIKRNSDDAAESFIYNGVVYKLANVKTRIQRAPSLEMHLVPEMRDYLKILQQSNNEVQTIWQALLPLVEKYGSSNGLPSNLKAILPITTGTATISFDAVLLDISSHHLLNWNDAKNKLNYYISLRLVT